MDDFTERVKQSVAGARKSILDVSHGVHELAETAFDESRSAALVAGALEQAGLVVERNAGDLPTAFVARVGSGDLHIGICAEYDALPGIGHACGHNIISAAAVGAAIALKPLVDELNLTISVFGTPGEEGSGGKILMLQRGVFDGVNAAVMVHPAPIERDAMRTLAISHLEVEYFGVAAHAAAAPQRGKSASAALTMAHTGIALLREHLEGDDRVHGIVTHGGDAPNVVPDNTKDVWLVRSRNTERLRELEAKVTDVFRGAALATGCAFEIRHLSPGYADVRSDDEIAAIWRANASQLGRKSLPPTPSDGLASTDMGNVSYAVPSIHPLLALASDGANIHESAFERFARSATGDDAAIDGATLMAMTVVDIARDAALRARLCAHAYSQREAGDAAYLARNWTRKVVFDPQVDVARRTD